MTFFAIFYFLVWPLGMDLRAQSAFGSPPPNLEPKLEILAEAESQPGGQIFLKVIGRLEPGFHLYSIKTQKGPKPTRLEIETPGIRALGETEESAPKLKLDEALEEKLWVHENEFFLKKTLVGKPLEGRELKGFIFFQLCDNLICLNPQKKYFTTLLK